MHPELLNNNLFLRYYKQWQSNPSSVVFAPIADFFVSYGMLDDAIKVCKEGLKRNPDLISGHIVLARAYIAKGDIIQATKILDELAEIAPNNRLVLKLKSSLQLSNKPKEVEKKSHIDRTASNDTPPNDAKASNLPWETLTMADIYISQGHYEKAKRIYKSILNREPDNEAAKTGINRIMKYSSERI